MQTKDSNHVDSCFKGSGLSRDKISSFKHPFRESGCERSNWTISVFVRLFFGCGHTYPSIVWQVFCKQTPLDRKERALEPFLNWKHPRELIGFVDLCEVETTTGEVNVSIWTDPANGVTVFAKRFNPFAIPVMPCIDCRLWSVELFPSF